MNLSRLAWVACALLAVTACSRKEKNVDPPAELVDFKPTLRVDRAWESGVGGGEPELRLGLGLVVDGERAYAAGHEGEIAAFDLRNGRKVWETRLKTTLAGGTGAGSGLVAAGSAKGDVFALDATTGAQRWKVNVRGEVLAAPTVGPNAVYVRTVDGRLRSLALDDGRELWMQEQAVPRLSLRGTSHPVLTGETVLCGFDNGKVAAYAVGDGSVLWEATVSPPRGRTELERIVDIDSSVRVLGEDVYAVGFQGRVAMLALDSGQIWWSREMSSHRGLDIDDEALYIATADGEVIAMRRRTAAELWRQKGLARRGLSAPAVLGNVVAVGDFQGYVHWMDKTTGEFVARTELGGRISLPPVVAGDLLLAINDKGRIGAWRIRQPVAAEAAPVSAPAPAADPPPAAESPSGP